MNDDKPIVFSSGKVLGTFFITSLVTAVVFALCVTSAAMQQVWFQTVEFWVIPTRKLGILATSLFLLNLGGAYFVAHSQKWLSFTLYRLITGGALIALFPMLAFVIQPSPPLSQFLLFRVTFVLVLSLALLIITERWHWMIASLMLATFLAIPLIASIPYAIFRSVSPEWFEVSEFFFASSLLSILFGWWLVRSRG